MGLSLLEGPWSLILQAEWSLVTQHEASPALDSLCHFWDWGNGDMVTMSRTLLQGHTAGSHFCFFANTPMFTILTPLLRTGLPSRLLWSSRLLSMPWPAFLELRSCGLTFILCCSTVSYLSWGSEGYQLDGRGTVAKLLKQITKQNPHQLIQIRILFCFLDRTNMSVMIWAFFFFLLSTGSYVIRCPFAKLLYPWFWDTVTIKPPSMSLTIFFFPFLLTSLPASIGTSTRVLSWPYFFFLYFLLIFPF